MPSRPADYFAYLIRLWRAEPGGPWRASLEDSRTGERIGFGGLTQACAYLLRKTEQVTEVTGIDEPLQNREEDQPPDTPASTERCG